MFKLHQIATFGIMIAAAACAQAGPVTTTSSTVTMVQNGHGGASAGISNTLTMAGDFSDTYTLSGLSGLAYFAGSLMTAGHDYSGIDFYNATINGTQYSLSQIAAGGFADYMERGSISALELGSPFTLVINGHAGDGLADGTAISATYSASVTLTSVPEPTSIALAGLGLLTCVVATRRRKPR